MKIDSKATCVCVCSEEDKKITENNNVIKDNILHILIVNTHLSNFILSNSAPSNQKSIKEY